MLAPLIRSQGERAPCRGTLFLQFINRQQENVRRFGIALKADLRLRSTKARSGVLPALNVDVLKAGLHRRKTI
jgi:hypothetical protein